MSNILQNNKVQEYCTYLEYRYWSLNEALYLLSGITEFVAFCHLDSEVQAHIGRESFWLFPDLDSTVSWDNTYKIIHDILRAINNDEINAFPYKMHYISINSSNITYFINPFDLLVYAVTNGFILPKELQKAAGIYQKRNSSTALTLPQKKQIKRETIAQLLWHRHPKSSISAICRQLQAQKISQNFTFIQDSETRCRGVVKKIMPTKPNKLPLVPEVIEENENYIAFDFQYIKLIVNLIADFLIKENHNISPEEIIKHPLIDIYSIQGGSSVKKIVEFSLMKPLHLLH